MNYSFQDRWCVSNFSVKMNQRPLTPPPRSSEPPLKLSANTISTSRRQEASKLATPVIFRAWPCISAGIRLEDERFDSALCHSSGSCVAHRREPQSEDNIPRALKMNGSCFVYFVTLKSLLNPLILCKFHSFHSIICVSILWIVSPSLIRKSAPKPAHLQQRSNQELRKT